MGNVPISCCRSKSPKLHSSALNRSNSINYRNGIEGQYSTANRDISHKGKLSGKTIRQGGEDLQDTNQPSNILQHISEREPDDSGTDPSSNPLNRPIFASRSSQSRSRSGTFYDTYSSSNSTSRNRSNTNPLTSSQDHGYNSTTSTNLTHINGQFNDSFDSSIQQRESQVSKSQVTTNLSVNRLSSLNSPSSTDDLDKLSKSDQLEDCARFTNIYSNGIIPKSSSCSTIFIDDSTISQPNLKQTIKCVSLAIYYHIKNRTSDSSEDIFDESLHPLKIPCANNTDEPYDELILLDQDESSSEMRLNEPDQKTIYNFVKALFKAAQLTSEYAITTLVYLERLMTYAEMDLTPKTWRRMFLGAILLSSKVWEDQAVWNVDYAQILEEISVEDINELERQFLGLIDFNMNVPSSVYAKYYFHLRTLAIKNGISKEYTMLTVGKAKTLEAMSSVHTIDCQLSPIHRKSSPEIKRHTSLEKLRLNGQARAVLM